jgi:selenocysteine lyase/cysteine desulfurase
MVGAGAAVDFLASLAADEEGAIPDRRAALELVFDALHARGDRLLGRLWSGLADIDGVTLYGPQPGTPRTPTVGFTVRALSTDAAAIELAKRAVFVSNGDFYAATVIDRLGLAPGGLVRAGCSCYTTEEEVDRLVDGVRSIA